MTSSSAYGLKALGVINALGNNKQQVLENLLSGKSLAMDSREGWIPEQSVCVGAVDIDLPNIPVALKHFNSRNNRLLLAALEQIHEDIDTAVEQYGRSRVAVVVGSSTSGILEGEQALAYAMENEQAPEEYNYRQQEIGAPALFLAEYLGLEGLAYTVSTACSSSAKVFASARNMLDLGLCDAVIVGGADSLCKLTLNGFNALAAVSRERCKPFSENRDGITIGEGAALFLLDRKKLLSICWEWVSQLMRTIYRRRTLKVMALRKPCSRHY